jgi:hypothetical protein
VLAALLLVAGIVADGPTTVPKGWIEVAPPATRREWQCANYSLTAYAISGGGASALDIRAVPSEEQAERRLALADGTLYASDHGEWGGTIEWEAKGSRERVQVHGDNTQALFARGEDVFALTGLSHLGARHGGLVRLRRAAGGWTAEKVLDLGTPFHASYRVDSDRVLVASGEGLSIIDLGKASMSRLHQNENWFGVFPNSVRPFGDAIALGARGAVIVLRSEGGVYAEHWWLPAQCRKDGDVCGCADPDLRKFIE